MSISFGIWAKDCFPLFKFQVRLFTCLMLNSLSIITLSFYFYIYWIELFTQFLWWHSVQFSGSAGPTLSDPMNCSTLGLPVHYQLLEFTQTHVNQVGDAIQPSHPLSSPSPPAPNPSQHQGLFPMSQLVAWGGQSAGVSASASVLTMNTQDWSPLGWTGWISCSPRDSRESSPTP